METLAEPMDYLSGQLVLGAATLPTSIAWVIGDSNLQMGNANNVSGVREFGVNSAFASVSYSSMRAPATTDPPSFNADSTISLQSFSTGGNPGFGPSVTLGRELFSINPNFGYIVEQTIISSFLSQHWLPTSTYWSSSSGGNLYRTARNRVQAYATSTGRTVTLIVVNLGTNDASDATAASNMAANMATMVTQLHSDFPNAVIVWPLVASATVQPNLSTVRTQMLSYASGAPSYFIMPNIDYTGMIDSFHWDPNGDLRIGSQWAFAGADKLGLARRTVTGVTLMGRGVAAQGNGSSLTVQSWPGIQDRHTELLWAIASGSTPGGGAGAQTISDPAGWTLRTSGQTTASGFTATWKIWQRDVGTGETAADSVSPSVDSRAPAVSVTFGGHAEAYLQRFAYDGPNPHPTFNVAMSMNALNAFDNNAHTLSALATGAGALVTYFIGGESFPTGNTATLSGGSLTGLAKFSETAHLMPDTGNVLASVWTGGASGSTGTPSAQASLSTLLCIAAVALTP